jgi:hypothetical protein
MTNVPSNILGMKMGKVFTGPINRSSICPCILIQLDQLKFQFEKFGNAKKFNYLSELKVQSHVKI